MTVENKDVYRALQQHLDEMPIGYPATESRVEIRLLKHLFTPEEAQIATKLSLQPEPLKKIYRRVKRSGISIEELEVILDEMYMKGLINYGKKDDEKYYFNAFLVVGMFEYQLKRLTKEFINDINQYFKEAFWEKELNKTRIPQLRTIPLEQSDW